MTSNLRILAAWANMYADWEEGQQVSPSIDDLVRVAADIWDRHPTPDVLLTWGDKLDLISQDGATLEEQLDALAEMVDEDWWACLPDPATALTFDQVEAAGLDGTLRTP